MGNPSGLKNSFETLWAPSPTAPGKVHNLVLTFVGHGTGSLVVLSRESVVLLRLLTRLLLQDVYQGSTIQRHILHKNRLSVYHNHASWLPLPRVLP